MNQDNDKSKQFGQKEDQFWGDKIKHLKRQGKINEVIAICYQNIPFPRAFKEMATALRKKLHSLESNSQDYDATVLELYSIAAYERFLFKSPVVLISKNADSKSRNISYPSFNVALEAHQDGVMAQLSLTYKDHGYLELKLLNKTDIKRIKEIWGEPLTHTNPQDTHLDIWDYYLSKFEMGVHAQNERMEKEYRQILDAPSKEKKNRWWPF